MPAAARHRRPATGRRLIAAALIAVSAPIAAFSTGSHPAFASSDEQKLQQLQHDASNAASDIGVRDAAAQQAALALAQLNVKVSAAQQSLAAANHNLATAQGILATRRTALARSQEAERKAQEQVDVAAQRYNAARNELRAMLRATYEEGVGGDLDALMEGGTPDDLADRVGLLDRLSATRQDRLAKLADTRNALQRKEDALAAARARAQHAVLAANEQLRTVAAAHQKAANAADALLALQHQQQSAVTAAKTAALTARAKYQRLQAESQRLQGILAARAAAQSGGALPLSSGAGSAVSTGGLIMPTTGTFTSGFGYRTDPFGLGTTFHAGQDIAAPMGTPIYAATAGTVAIVETPDQSGGYGNFTCIDRGGGFATCYAHQSAVLVHVGQVVTQGQEIGLVGSTGASTGPHLHFEVRINGVPVDPDPYLP